MNAWIPYIERRLSGFYTSDQSRELAFRIMEELTGCTRTELITDCKDTEKNPHLEIILQKLCKFEPIEYIFGHTEWMGLDLQLNSATLIPRPETAELVQEVEQVGACLGKDLPLRILDVGTGSGCIALALKRYAPWWEVRGVDVNEEAVRVARTNAVRNRVDVHFEVKDILKDTVEAVDILVSNPPYVCESERKEMLPNVLQYEPHGALFVPDSDPLLFYRRMARLKAARWVCFEMNERFGGDMCRMLQQEGYEAITLKQDQYGKDRIVTAAVAR